MFAVWFILFSVTDTFVIHITRALRRLTVLKKHNSFRNASNLTTATSDERLYICTPRQMPHSGLKIKLFTSLQKIFLFGVMYVYTHMERDTHKYTHTDVHMHACMYMHIPFYL